MAINFKKLIFSILLPIIPSFIISMISDPSSTFDKLVLPSFSPPAPTFGIVWTILYVLMGISSYLVLTTDTNDKKAQQTGLILYFIQLVLNFLWTPIFFGLEMYLLGSIWILIMIVFVIFMIINFSRVNKYAAILQLPYLIWLIFAAYLSFSIYFLNVA